MPEPSDNVVAVLTAAGRSALATVALAGPAVWAWVRPLFRPAGAAPLPERPVAGRFWLGRLGGEVADEVVLAVRAADPVPRLEIHAHGGREVVRALVEALEGAGARRAGFEDWLGPTPAEQLLPRAPTARTAAIVLDQCRGAFERELLASAGDRERLGLLRERWDLGRHLSEPFRVVLAGAPNVGKSSLANALAGYARSVVSPTPGTTRDLVTAEVALDGWPVLLTDSAGIRPGAGPLEALGIERARAAAAAADLVLWLVDGSVAPGWPDFEAPNVRLVVNKVDLPAAWDHSTLDAPRVSAVTGLGVPELGAAVAGWLVPQPPPPGAGLPLTAEQRQTLDDLLAALP